MPILVLDKFEAVKDEAGFEWRTQLDCLGLIDLSSAKQIEESDPSQPRGWHLALYRRIPEGLFDREGVILTDEDVRDAKTTGKMQDVMEQLLGHRPVGNRVLDLIVDLLTFGGDPRGQDRPFPITPSNNKIEIWFGSVVCREDFKFGASRFSNLIMECIKYRLEFTRNQVINGNITDVDYHLKFADHLVERFVGDNIQNKINLFEMLKPNSWGSEGLKPHETSYSENFNTADSSTLGPNLTWTETTGDMDVLSNECRQVSTSLATSISRAEHDTSSVDVYAQVDQTGTGTTLTGRSSACICRMAAGAETGYLARQRGGASGNGALRITKIVAGTLTDLGSGSTQAQIGTKKVSANGTTIKSFHDGSEAESITDSAIDGVTVGGKRGGLLFSCARSEFKLDNFEFGDISTFIPLPTVSQFKPRIPQSNISY